MRLMNQAEKRKNNFIMKKITTLFVLAFAIFIQVGSAYAQTPSPAFQTPQMPGVSCGNAYDSQARVCCKPPEIKVDSAIPATNTIIDPAIYVINSLISSLLSPITKSINGVFADIQKPCLTGAPSTPDNLQSAQCLCVESNLQETLKDLCKPIASSAEQGRCNACHSEGGVWTGIGCVDSNLQYFIERTLLGLGIGFAGGITLLCIIFAAFQMQTSRGNAEKIKKAQELLTNCVVGLMVIIFSMLILKIIGVDILRIPGFG
jgi:hypothetical protein